MVYIKTFLLEVFSTYETIFCPNKEKFNFNNKHFGAKQTIKTTLLL